jgi:hypothetical protein
MSNTWTWEEINQDWLLGNPLALSSEEVVSAFNRVALVFGRDWMEGTRTQAGITIGGTSPTLGVVTLGQMLVSLEGARGTDELIGKLRKGDPSAFAELGAVHLIRSEASAIDLELGPAASVGDRARKPDFRIRRGSEAWTYVEVTQPDIAESRMHAQAILNRLADLVRPIKRSFALEVFLRREPTNSELSTLSDLVQQFCLLEGDQSKNLPDLAILSLNASAPGLVVPRDHVGEPNVPRLGCAKGIYGPDEPHRHISVRMAYADDRAEDFLRKEAKQLPNDSPGLVMVQISNAPGGIISWEPVLKRRFQPNVHTRVSAVCLFMSGQQLTETGVASIPEAKLLPNPHAHFPLPAWIAEALSKAAPARYT